MNKGEMEYYMRRKNVYYFRSDNNKMSITCSEGKRSLFTIIEKGSGLYRRIKTGDKFLIAINDE